MKRQLLVFSASLVLGGSLLLVGPTAFGQDRTPEALAAEIDSVAMPEFDASRRAEEGYRDEYLQKRAEALKQKAELILELYRAAPDHELTVKHMPERWSMLTNLNNGDTTAVRAEAGEYLKNHPEGPLVQEAKYALAQAELSDLWRADDASKPEAVKKIRAYADAYPQDDRSANLLATVVQYHITDPAESKKIWKNLIENYPDHRSAKYWPGKLRQLEGIGQPFELEFTDAIGGSEVSMDRLEGKVVVVDFWATWCGPCVAEMPHMKELYAKYKDKGVEFIGVSLDQPEEDGGLQKLRDYCAENGIEWPQYYQGNYWSSEFSTSWGINSIPTMFIIDKEGNLHSTEARGELDTMIPKLLGIEPGVEG